MSKTVFILGAGASVCAGAPVMKNFLDKANDLLQNQQTAGNEEHFKRIFEQKSEFHIVHHKSRISLDNIESMYAIFEMARVLKRLPGLEEELSDKEFESYIDNYKTSLNRLIVTTLERTMGFPTEEYDDFAKLLLNLRDKLETSRAYRKSFTSR